MINGYVNIPNIINEVIEEGIASSKAVSKNYPGIYNKLIDIKKTRKPVIGIVRAEYAGTDIGDLSMNVNVLYSIGESSNNLIAIYGTVPRNDIRNLVVVSKDDKINYML